MSEGYYGEQVDGGRTVGVVRWRGEQSFPGPGEDGGGGRGIIIKRKGGDKGQVAIYREY